MPNLSLDSLTLTGIEPKHSIRAATGADFDTVGLWVQEPVLYPSPLMTAAKEAECAALLTDTGLFVETLEVFDLVSIEGIESYHDALERGAGLGGKTALALNYSNPDRAQSAEVLAAFVKMAADYGLGVNLEPVAGGQTSTLRQASDLIRATGVDVGITLDPHHLIRSGDGLTELQAVDPELIRHAQVSCSASRDSGHRSCL